MEEIPFTVIGGEELSDKNVEETYHCKRCGENHIVKYGTDSKTGEKTTMLGFIKCREIYYLVSVDGKLLN